MVIAIISLLVSILLPSLNKAKELALTTICTTNFHRLGQAIMLHVEDHDGTLPGPLSSGQKLGYSSTRTSDRYHIPRALGEYLDLPEPEPEAQFAESIACPGWLKYAPGDKMTSRVYLTYANIDRTDGTWWKCPYGRPNNYEPWKVWEIARPDISKALSDLDRALVAVWTELPEIPVHPSGRTVLFFDFHIEMEQP